MSWRKGSVYRKWAPLLAQLLLWSGPVAWAQQDTPDWDAVSDEAREPASGAESEVPDLEVDPLDLVIADSDSDSGSGSAAIAEEAQTTDETRMQPEEEVPVIPLQRTPPEAVAMDDKPGHLEEIVVTAQRKVQSIYDVPISMTVMDDKFLAEQGITDLTEASRYVPNTKIRADLAFGQGASIRGFTRQSGNAAFEQAVGLLVDGVSYTDNDYFMTSLFDVERIEILRGPQGTLLGKNTTGGLLNITTKEATNTYEGFLDLQSGEAGRQLLEGAFGGPVLNDVLNFRVALSSDARDGVFGNTTADVMEGVPRKVLSRNRSSLRVKLEAPDLFGSRLRLQYERAKAEYVGTGFEIVDGPAGNIEFLRQYDPNLDTEPGNFVGSVDHAGDTDRSVEKLIARWTYDIGEWSLDAIASKGSVSGGITGSDATPAPLTYFLFDNDKPQSGFEFIATTPALFGAFDLTAGLFWQRRELAPLLTTLEIDTLAFAAWIASASTPTPPPAPPPAPAEGREVTTLVFNQLSDSFAGYGQITWSFAEHWSVIGGIRVAEERKSADWDRTVSENSVLLTQVLGYEEFTAQRERSEVLTMPKVALQYRPSRTISLFAHWAQGFRSGGFNAGATSGDGLEFDPEVVTEWAVNAKTQFFDGELRLNAGLFRDELNDFQLLTQDPDTMVAATANAGQVVAQGLEADVTWAPSNWLTFIGALGTNDATFTDFKYGPCASDRRNTDEDDDPRCDLTGETPSFIPKWSGSLTTNVGIPLGGFGGSGLSRFLARQGIEIQTGVTIEFSGDQNTGLPGDDRFTQDAFYRINASLAIAGVAQGWSLRITGDNLTNEAVNRGRGLVNSSSVVVQQTEPPRLVYGQFRWDF